MPESVSGSKHTGSRRIGPKLQWVVVDGFRVASVTEFSGLPARARPAAVCPQCGRSVILRLGKIVVPHAAHRPGDLCAATAPETALHLNAKFHLAAQLRTSLKIRIIERCQRSERDWEPCTETRIKEWEPNWTQVEVELAVGGRRPDITLLHHSVPVGAIEVWVTHRVGPEKAADLGVLKLPWLEVEGSQVLPAQGPAWLAGRPLPVYREAPHEPWECPTCAQKTAEERYQRLNGVHVRAVRIVDIYHRSGKKFRELFSAFVELRDGVVIAVGLMASGGRLVHRIDGPDTIENKRGIKEAFEKELSQYESRGAIIDSPMSWHRSDGAFFDSEMVTYSDLYFRRRYRWSHKNTRWFLLREYQHLNWDDGHVSTESDDRVD